MNLFLSGKNNLVLATRTLIDGSTVNQSTARESTCVYKPIRGPGNRLHGPGGGAPCEMGGDARRKF